MIWWDDELILSRKRWRYYRCRTQRIFMDDTIYVKTALGEPLFCYTHHRTHQVSAAYPTTEHDLAQQYPIRWIEITRKEALAFYREVTGRPSPEESRG